MDPRNLEHGVTVDECPACNGLWIDGSELMTACRTLAHLPENRSEVSLTGNRGAGIAKCPRCEIAPFEIRILGVDVDFCTRCAGVFLDGPERAPLGVTLEDRGRGKGTGGAYREVVVDEGVAADGVACRGCGKRVPFRDTLASEDGLICETCHAGADLKVAKERAAAGQLNYQLGRIAFTIFLILTALVSASKH